MGLPLLRHGGVFPQSPRSPPCKQTWACHQSAALRMYPPLHQCPLSPMLGLTLRADMGLPPERRSPHVSPLHQCPLSPLLGLTLRADMGLPPERCPPDPAERLRGSSAGDEERMGGASSGSAWGGGQRRGGAEWQAG